MLYFFFYLYLYISAPGQVKSLTVTPTSYNSLDVSWNEPSNECGIDYYKVTHQLELLDQCSEPNNPQVIIQTTTTTSTTIEDLQPYSTYHIDVAAWLDDLKGDSETTSSQTDESSKVFSCL